MRLSVAMKSGPSAMPDPTWRTMAPGSMPRKRRTASTGRLGNQSVAVADSGLVVAKLAVGVEQDADMGRDRRPRQRLQRGDQAGGVRRAGIGGEGGFADHAEGRVHQGRGQTGGRRPLRIEQEGEADDGAAAMRAQTPRAGSRRRHGFGRRPVPARRTAGPPRPRAAPSSGQAADGLGDQAARQGPAAVFGQRAVVDHDQRHGAEGSSGPRRR